MWSTIQVLVYGFAPFNLYNADVADAVYKCYGTASDVIPAVQHKCS